MQAAGNFHHDYGGHSSHVSPLPVLRALHFDGGTCSGAVPYTSPALSPPTRQTRLSGNPDATNPATLLINRDKTRSFDLGWGIAPSCYQSLATPQAPGPCWSISSKSVFHHLHYNKCGSSLSAERKAIQESRWRR